MICQQATTKQHNHWQASQAPAAAAAPASPPRRASAGRSGALQRIWGPQRAYAHNTQQSSSSAMACMLQVLPARAPVAAGCHHAHPSSAAAPRQRCLLCRRSSKRSAAGGGGKARGKGGSRVQGIAWPAQNAHQQSAARPPFSIQKQRKKQAACHYARTACNGTAREQWHGACAGHQLSTKHTAAAAAGGHACSACGENSHSVVSRFRHHIRLHSHCRRDGNRLPVISAQLQWCVAVPNGSHLRAQRKQ